MPEETFRQSPCSAHAEKQPRGASLAAHPAAERGQNEREGHTLKQHVAAHHSRDIYESRLQVREGVKVGPHSLRKIHLQTAEQSGERADVHGCQQDIAPWILHLFRQRGYAVKPNIGERREGCGRGDSREGSVSWSVEGRNAEDAVQALWRNRKSNARTINAEITITIIPRRMVLARA